MPICSSVVREAGLCIEAVWGWALPYLAFAHVVFGVTINLAVEVHMEVIFDMSSVVVAALWGLSKARTTQANSVEIPSPK